MSEIIRGRPSFYVETAEDPSDALVLVEEIYSSEPQSGLILLNGDKKQDFPDKPSGWALDWDGVATETNKDPDDRRRKSSFELVDRQMSASGQAESQSMRDYYEEHLQDVSDKEAVQWTTRSIELHADQGLTEDNARIAGRNSVLREGFVELVHQIQKDSKLSIVSYGLADTITFALQDIPGLDELPDVYAAKYQYDLRGRIIGYHPKTLISPATKPRAIKAFCQEHGITESNLVIMGDSESDLMMKTDENAYFIFVAHSGYGQTGNMDKKKMNEIFPDTNAILVGESLQPVVEYYLN